jgi:D-threo-aldose 1-dehydrogenase
MNKTLLSSSLTLGELGLGTSALGNLYREVDDSLAREVVDAAWDEGVRYFDTAPHYGLGLAERRIGSALADRPREEYTISTKIGRILEPTPDGAGELDPEGFVVPAASVRRWDFSAAGVRQSLEQSLERTGLDRIDILYMHDPEEHLDQAMEEALPELVSLRSQGIVRAIGVGSKDVAAMTRLVATGALDLAMVAGRYTLLEQPALEKLLPAAEESGTRIVAVGVFNSGLLATSNPDPNSHYEYGAVPVEKLTHARALAEVCARHRIALPHAAIQFALMHPQSANVTLGIGSTAHMATNAEWARTAVPDELWRELEELDLIPRGVTLV